MTKVEGKGGSGAADANGGAGETSVRMSVEEVSAFIDEVFPQIHHGGRIITIEAIRPMGARLRMIRHERTVRPGGTISGPAMFTLADVGIFIAILGALGPVPLAVTTNMTINFLRKPAARDMIAEVELLKLGKRLAVGEVALYSEGESAMVAHATATYSIPPGAMGEVK